MWHISVVVGGWRARRERAGMGNRACSHRGHSHRQRRQRGGLLVCCVCGHCHWWHHRAHCRGVLRRATARSALSWCGMSWVLLCWRVAFPMLLVTQVRLRLRRSTSVLVTASRSSHHASRSGWCGPSWHCCNWSSHSLSSSPSSRFAPTHTRSRAVSLRGIIHDVCSVLL